MGVGVKHGHYVGGKASPTMSSWEGMVQRCTNPNHIGYPRYGGRGITVCGRWLGSEGFENFLSDMGERPAGMSIDRKDNDLGYSPDNCRWASKQEQTVNKSDRKLAPRLIRQIRWLLEIGYQGASVARMYGVTRSMIGHIKKGRAWSYEC